MKTKLITALSFALLLSSQSAFAENKLEGYEKEIDNLEEKVESTNNKKEEFKTELKNVNRSIDEVQKLLNEITSKINDTDSKINTVTNDIELLRVQIEEQILKIDEMQIELERKQDILGKSLRTLYIKGQSTFIEILLKADSWTELLERFDIIKDISKGNKQLMKEVESKKIQLQNEKAILDKNKKDQESKKNELEKLKSTQEKQKSEQDELKKELEAKASEIETHIQHEEAAEKALMNEIAHIIEKREAEKKRIKEEEEKKRLEEERKRLEAEKANAEKANAEKAKNEESQRTLASEPVVTSSGGSIALPMKPGTYYISSTYGWRIHPVHGTKRLHNGTDFAAGLGAPLYAVSDGYVLFAGPANGYGNWIVLELDNGMYAIYGHMYSNQIFVSSGQRVKQGQHIGGVGSAGTSTGNHLHFSLATSYSGGAFNYVNPQNHF